MRRSLADVASAIWGGFHFRLETPSFDWEKMVGGTSMGASMGLIIQNFIDIDIGKLDSTKFYLGPDVFIIGLKCDFNYV